jgi:hypothetical protein
MASEKKIGEIFMTFLLVIIGLALTPTVQTSTTTASAALSGAAATLCDLIPLFWVVIILAIGIAAVYIQLRSS